MQTLTFSHVVKSDWPSTQWFMAAALLHCNEGWRKRAQCFTLINGATVLQSCWNKTAYLSLYSSVSRSINQSINQIRLLYISCQWWSDFICRDRLLEGLTEQAAGCVCLPVTSTTSDSKAPRTICVTDWPPTVCWLTGVEAWGGKGERLENISVSPVGLHSFSHITPADNG